MNRPTPTSVLAREKWWVSAETRAKNAANVLLAAEAAAAEEAVAGFQRDQYETTWLPLLSRRSLPGYVRTTVPGWAVAMHERETADA